MEGTHTAIFQPGHQGLDVSAGVSGAEVSLRLICDRLNLRPWRTPDRPTRPICVQSPGLCFREHKGKGGRLEGEGFYYVPGNRW